MNGDSFDIKFDDDQITIEHHVRDERLSVVRERDEWIARTGPLDDEGELTEQ